MGGQACRMWRFSWDSHATNQDKQKIQWQMASTSRQLMWFTCQATQTSYRYKLIRGEHEDKPISEGLKEIDLGLWHNFTRVRRTKFSPLLRLLVKDTGGTHWRRMACRWSEPFLVDGLHGHHILEGLRSPGQSQHTRCMIYLQWLTTMTLWAATHSSCTVLYCSTLACMVLCGSAPCVRMTFDSVGSLVICVSWHPRFSCVNRLLCN
jgi:hypothetical protein